MAPTLPHPELGGEGGAGASSRSFPPKVRGDARPTRAQPCGDLSLVETRLDHGDLVIDEAEELIDEHVHAILAAHPLSSESFSGKRCLSASEFAPETREFGGSPLKLLRNV